MSQRLLGLCGGLLTLLCSPTVAAQTPSAAQLAPAQRDALAWLQKVPAAARQLSYSGTFVLQNGMRSETSRIVHIAAGANQYEKLDVLDGSPREVVRHNDEVRCYLPERRLVMVEQRSTRKSFPALLPASLSGLGEYYQIRKVVVARVAGRDSQVIRLDPRDGWRYARQFWVDLENGLLLKAEVIGANGESLESLSFTELQLGVPAGVDAVSPAFLAERPLGKEWEVRQPRMQEMRDEAGWQFRGELPGFRRQSAMLRGMGAAADTREVRHWVFTDGLAAVSVFISPATGDDSATDEQQAYGATNVFKRSLNGYKVVVMGDVPAEAIRHIAQGIGVRGK